jgi:hypothetical protein
MAVGSIPWTAIVAWCEYHQLDRDHADAVIYVIRSLDIAQADRQSAERAAQTATGARR